MASTRRCSSSLETSTKICLQLGPQYLTINKQCTSSLALKQQDVTEQAFVMHQGGWAGGCVPRTARKLRTLRARESVAWRRCDRTGLRYTLHTSQVGHGFARASLHRRTHEPVSDPERALIRWGHCSLSRSRALPRQLCTNAPAYALVTHLLSIVQLLFVLI